VVHASCAKEVLPELVAAGGDAFAIVGGLSYRVTPKESGFRSASDVLTSRMYHSYDEYLDHQASKLEERADFVFGSSEKRYRHMRERFGEIVATLQLAGTALCLGARLGEEVRAFRDLGLVAIGIDLNPGERNPYCMYGDFHHLQYPENSFDLVYSNTLDHVLDLDKFMREAVRVAKPQGRIYFDLGGGFKETGALDPYGALFWPTNAALIEALRPYIGQIVFDRQPANQPGRQFIFQPRK
jgi:SAM-dependent methyltransferase